MPAPNNALNVFGKPLSYFGGSPIKSGFFRDGYCRTSVQDHGSHSIAATVSTQFLDFSASRGNDLRIVGLDNGCKWCLCASRWKEAFDAWQDGVVGIEAVPKIDLTATEDNALRKIDLSELKRFAIEDNKGEL